MVWEFDAVVTEVARPTVRLRLAGTPRGTNYRRYIRAATRKPAYVALFPFLKEAAEGESLQFTSGTLIEIGGPGLRVIAPVRTDVGERVAVRVIMANQWSIQGIGTVRRSRPVGGGDWESVVEMTGLTEEELERLVRETNAAAKQAVAAEEVAVHALVRN
jgi:hypothetical protein